VAVSVRVDLHHAQIRNFLYSPGGPVVRGVRRWSREVRDVAIINAPKDTGELAGSSLVDMNTHPGFVVGVISFRARHAAVAADSCGSRTATVSGPAAGPALLSTPAACAVSGASRSWCTRCTW
jgi:hypothetical protein